MAAIEAIEATGNILFSYTTRVAQELQSITQQEYIYFGKFHLTVETGHAISGDDTEAQLASIALRGCLKRVTDNGIIRVSAVITQRENRRLSS